MKKLIPYLIFGLVICKKLCSVLAQSDPPLRVQQALDRADILKYLQNERLIKLQFQCLVFDKPCDIVGKWIKPRAKAALATGECIFCTPNQANTMKVWLENFKHGFPEMYAAAYKKYVENGGKPLSEEDKEKLKETFNHKAIATYLEGFKDLVTKLRPAYLGNNSTTTQAPSSSSVAPDTITTIKPDEMVPTTTVPPAA